jgi:hypothetical protein
LSERGLRVELGGYQYRAFTDIRVVHDHDGAWRRLADSLGADGVQDPEAAVQDLRTAALQDAVVALLQGWARWSPGEPPLSGSDLVAELNLRGFPGDPQLAPALRARLEAVAAALTEPEAIGLPAALCGSLLGRASSESAERFRFMGVPLAFTLLACLRGQGWTDCGAPRALPAALRLETAIARALEGLGGGGWEAARDARLVWLLAGLELSEDWPGAAGISRELGQWLGANEHQGVTYVDQGQLETLLSSWQLLALLPDPDAAESLATAAQRRALRASELLSRAQAAGWRLEGLG